MHGLMWRALETGRPRSAICGSRAGVLRNATTMAWSGPSRPISRYRASARPYDEHPAANYSQVCPWPRESRGAPPAVLRRRPGRLTTGALMRNSRSGSQPGSHRAHLRVSRCPD